MRGDIYLLPALKDARGHMQSDALYVVVVQSDALPLPTTLIAPTTTKSFPAVFHPEIELDGTTSLVLVEQTRAVDPERLGKFAGRLDAHEMDEIDRALRIVMGLF